MKVSRTDLPGKSDTELARLSEEAQRHYRAAKHPGERGRWADAWRAINAEQIGRRSRPPTSSTTSSSSARSEARGGPSTPPPGQSLAERVQAAKEAITPGLSADVRARAAEVREEMLASHRMVRPGASLPGDRASVSERARAIAQELRGAGRP